MPVLTEEPLHLVLAEAEHLIVFRGEHIVHLEVVEVGEDALLRYPHHAGDDGESERPVALERGSEQGFDESLDLLVQLFVPVGAVQGVVVLVDEDDRFLAVVRLDHLAQVEDGVRERVVIGGHLGQIPVPLLQVGAQLLRILQLPELAVEGEHPVPERLLELLVALDLEVLEIQVDDEVRVLLGVVRADPGDFQVREAVGLVGVVDVEVRVRHAEVESLPEPAGTGDQSDLRLRPQQLVDEFGFVHEVEVLIPQIPEVIAPDRHAFHGGSFQSHMRQLR